MTKGIWHFSSSPCTVTVTIELNHSSSLRRKCCAIPILTGIYSRHFLAIPTSQHAIGKAACLNGTWLNSPSLEERETIRYAPAKEGKEDTPKCPLIDFDGLPNKRLTDFASQKSKVVLTMLWFDDDVLCDLLARGLAEKIARHYEAQLHPDMQPIWEGCSSRAGVQRKADSRGGADAVAAPGRRRKQGQISRG